MGRGMIKPLEEDDPRHGTPGGYSNHRCRCDACRSASEPYRKRYVEKHPERVKASQRAHYERNREAIIAKAKSRLTPAEKAEYDRKRRERLGDELRAKERQRRLEKGEEIRAKERARYALNPMARLTHAANRVSRERDGDFTPDQWVDLLEEFGEACAYCHARGVPLQMEHMTPLSRGGRHAKDNIVPACGGCNGRKYNRTLFEFLALT